MERRTQQYAETLARMIRTETVSSYESPNTEKFGVFRRLLKELFPQLFSQCEYTEFERSFMLRWKGRDVGKQSEQRKGLDISA